MKLLNQWPIARLPKRGRLVWRYLPIVIVWTIWEERNMQRFVDKRKISRHLIECISIRLAHWAMEEPSFKGITIDYLIRKLPIVIESAPHVQQVIQVWFPPIAICSETEL